MVKENIKKVAAVCGIALIGATLGGIAVKVSQPQPEQVVEEVVIQLPGEVVTETVTVNNTVEVEVDNGNLDLVLDHIYDNDGSIDYLTEDLDDDEVSQIVERIAFINEAKALAVAEVEKEAKDELDKEVFNGSITFDEDDVERVRVQDDDDEVSVESVDFEDKDCDVLVDVNFEQEDVKYTATFKVEIKDNEVEDLDLESVSLR